MVFWLQKANLTPRVNAALTTQMRRSNTGTRKSKGLLHLHRAARCYRVVLNEIEKASKVRGKTAGVSRVSGDIVVKIHEGEESCRIIGISLRDILEVVKKGAVLGDIAVTSFASRVGGILFT